MTRIAQAKTEQELKEERERNQDDITHLEDLEKHYKKRGDIYEVLVLVGLLDIVLNIA